MECGNGRAVQLLLLNLVTSERSMEAADSKASDSSRFTVYTMKDMIQVAAAVFLLTSLTVLNLHVESGRVQNGGCSS